MYKEIFISIEERAKSRYPQCIKRLTERTSTKFISFPSCWIIGAVD